MSRSIDRKNKTLAPHSPPEVLSINLRKIRALYLCIYYVKREKERDRARESSQKKTHTHCKEA